MVPVHNLGGLWKVGERNALNPGSPIIDRTEFFYPLQAPAQTLRILIRGELIRLPQTRHIAVLTQLDPGILVPPIGSPLGPIAPLGTGPG